MNIDVTGRASLVFFFSLARLLVLCELSRYSTFSHISTLLSQPICEFTIVLLCNSLTCLNIYTAKSGMILSSACIMD